MNINEANHLNTTSKALGLAGINIEPDVLHTVMKLSEHVKIVGDAVSLKSATQVMMAARQEIEHFNENGPAPIPSPVTKEIVKEVIETIVEEVTEESTDHVDCTEEPAIVSKKK